MQEKLNVFLTGHSKPELEELKILLSQLSGISLTSKLADSHYPDPLYGLNDLPEVLIVHLGHRAEGILKALANRPFTQRPVVLVIGEGDDNPSLMRLALQAGVRDFYPYPIPEKEVTDTLRKIAQEKTSAQTGHAAKLSVFINSKNGSGASTLAANVAHTMANQAHNRVALVDLDLQFGPQLLNFNLSPQQGLFELLNEIHQVDMVAFTSFLAPYKNGLNVLAALPEQVGLQGDVSLGQLKQLVGLLRASYDHIVIDVPRVIDPMLSAILEQADQIVLCLQQDVVSLRDAQLLLRVFRQDMEIPDGRITLAVNRYLGDLPIRLDDIKTNLNINSIVCVPNDYARASKSINLGIPLSELAPQADIVKGIAALAMALGGIKAAPKKTNLLTRLFR